MIFTESEVVEFKSKIIGDICKEVIAFANSKGGTLYIGVEDNGSGRKTKYKRKQS